MLAAGEDRVERRLLERRADRGAHLRALADDVEAADASRGRWSAEAASSASAPSSTCRRRWGRGSRRSRPARPPGRSRRRPAALAELAHEVLDLDCGLPVHGSHCMNSCGRALNSGLAWTSSGSRATSNGPPDGGPCPMARSSEQPAELPVEIFKGLPRGRPRRRPRSPGRGPLRRARVSGSVAAGSAVVTLLPSAPSSTPRGSGLRRSPPSSAGSPGQAPRGRARGRRPAPGAGAAAARPRACARPAARRSSR